MKIPKAPTDGTIRYEHPVNNWVQSVGDQLSSYKQSKEKTFLPHVSKYNTITHDQASSRAEETKRKQFSTLNCEPYHRDQKTNFGVSKYSLTNIKCI